MKETVINAFADKAVLERLFTNGPGELLAVNSKAGYLKAGQDVYMLCSADLGITPIGIAVDDYAAAAAALRLSAGGRFDTADDALVFRGGVLRVQPYPRRAPQEPWGTFRTERIEAAARLLSALGRTSGLVPLADALCLGAAPEKGIAANPFCAKAYGPLVRLRDGLARNDVEAVPVEVKSLLGLGIGLTPSADDVLCGMTYTLLHGARKLTAADVEFVNAVRRYAPKRTNLISAAILKAVADGGRFEMMDNVLRGLTGAGEDGAQRLLTIGSSSGSEMLLGITIAAKLIHGRGQL